jgi:hydrogenase-4 membrane subunit HyfE
MKEIFQGKVFWMILITLLLGVLIYPPFSFKELRTGAVGLREWNFIFSPPEYKEIEMKILFVEAIIALLLTIGICLIPFKKIGLLLKWGLTNQYLKWGLLVIVALILIFLGLSKYHDFVERQRLKEIKGKKEDIFDKRFRPEAKKLDQIIAEESLEEQETKKSSHK